MYLRKGKITDSFHFQGYISLFNTVFIFKKVLEYDITEHDLLSLLADCESSELEDTANNITFPLFLQLIEEYIEQNEEGEQEQDLVCFRVELIMQTFVLILFLLIE